MKKLIIILCCSILLCGLFWGHSKTCNKTDTNNLITKLKKENQKLKKQLQNGKKEIEENKALRQQFKNGMEEVKSSREGNSLRLEIEKKFYHILRLMERGDIEELKTLVTKNIVVENHKIINQHGYKKEFSIPKGNTYYIPRYFSSNTENGVELFGTAYEIYHDDNSGYNGSLQVLYVNFKRIDGEWTLDSMEIDIN